MPTDALTGKNWQFPLRIFLIINWFHSFTDCRLQRTWQCTQVPEESLRPSIPTRWPHSTCLWEAEKATDEKKQEVMQYIEDTWMTSTVWTAPTWSVFNQSIRTNNDVEGIINFLWNIVHLINSAFDLLVTLFLCIILLLSL